MNLSKKERQNITNIFLHICSDLSEKSACALIGINKRALQRYKAGHATPNLSTVLRIKRIIKLGKKVELKKIKNQENAEQVDVIDDVNEADLDIILEELRERRSKRKQLNSLISLPFRENRPEWYEKAYELLSSIDGDTQMYQKKIVFESVYILLVSIYETKEIWKHVSIDILVWSLEKLATVAFYLGRVHEACHYIKQAIDCNESNVNDPYIKETQVSLFNNAGIFFASVHKLEESNAFLRKSLEISSDGSGLFCFISYINGLCVGSLSNSIEVINYWVGLLEGKLQHQSHTKDELKELYKNILQDNELHWAIEKGLLKNIILKIESLLNETSSK